MGRGSWERLRLDGEDAPGSGDALEVVLVARGRRARASCSPGVWTEAQRTLASRAREQRDGDIGFEVAEGTVCGTLGAWRIDARLVVLAMLGRVTQA